MISSTIMHHFHNHLAIIIITHEPYRSILIATKSTIILNHTSYDAHAWYPRHHFGYCVNWYETIV